MTSILFFPPRAFFGKLIAAVSHHAPGVPEVAHVAIVYNDTDIHNFVFEAFAPNGVREGYYTKGQGIKFNIELDPTKLNQIRQEVNGAKYDWLAYPFLAIDGLFSFFGKSIHRNPFQNKNRWVCSELVAYVIQECAVDPKYVKLIKDGPSCWSPQRLINTFWGTL